MKKIKIFLASSIVEFKNIRIMIGDIIRQIQNKVIEDNIRLDLFMCEYEDNSMNKDRMQERYNDKLRESNIFIMLIGKNVGEFTIEEYEVSKEINNLKRYILFQKVETNDIVNKFRNKLENDKLKNIENTIYQFDNEEELTNIIKEIVEKNTKLGEV